MARTFNFRSTLGVQILVALVGAYAGCSSDSVLEDGLALSRQHAYVSVPYRGVNLAGAEFAAERPSAEGISGAPIAFPHKCHREA